MLAEKEKKPVVASKATILLLRSATPARDPLDVLNGLPGNAPPPPLSRLQPHKSVRRPAFVRGGDVTN